MNMPSFGAPHLNGSGRALTGRGAECEALDRLVTDVRAGRSQLLVLRGEAGIGKTVLLDDLARRASGCRIARAGGVESEMELAFAGLHQLCAPMLERLDQLPVPQRDALATAFGLSAGPAPDRFLVGLAVLSLLAQVAEDRPLICLVDDGHWLDRASAHALEFVARRLPAESVALVLTVRSEGTDHRFATAPELVLEGLSEQDARELLGSTLPGPLDSAVRERIIADSRGNPLALVEAPHGLTQAELAGGFGLPHTQPVAGSIEDFFRRRLEPLPGDTRRLMLLAALEPVGDVHLLWRAAARLGIAADAAVAAESAGLLELGTRVRFRHPLVRSAVCRASNPQDLREAHRALAEATDPELDADRRAWHLAHAASGPDEAVADELERSAERARTRGGVAAAAAFLKRATELTPDAGHRGRRALAAARSAIDAGAPHSANDLLVAAEMCPLEDVERAELERLRAEAVFTLTRGSQTAPLLLLEAAKRLEPLDLSLARETYLEAMAAAHLAGRADLREVAEAARRLPPANPARPCDLLLDGLATRFTQGCAAGAPLLKRALEAFRGPDLPPEDGLRWLWLAATTALDMWDDEALEALTARYLSLARGFGSLAVLPLALNSRIAAHVIAGELNAAAALAEEASSVVDASGNYMPPYGALLVAAWRGDGPGGDRSGGGGSRHRGPAGRGRQSWSGPRPSVLSGPAATRTRSSPIRAAGRVSRGAGGFHLGTGRGHRSRLPDRDARGGSRGAVPVGGDDAGQWHRLGAWCGGAFAWLGQHRGGGRGPLPGVGEASGLFPGAGGVGAFASCLRRMATPRRPPRGRPRTTAHRPRDVRRHGSRGVRRTGPPRAAGHRGECA